MDGFTLPLKVIKVLLGKGPIEYTEQLGYYPVAMFEGSKMKSDNNSHMRALIEEARRKIQEFSYEKYQKDANKVNLVFVLPALRAGGVEKVVLALSHGFLDSGVGVDVVLACAEGEFIDNVPSRVNIINLNIPHRFRLVRSFVPLIKYFRNRKVDVVFPLFDGFELIVIFAVFVASIGKERPLVIYSCHSITKYLDSLPRYKRFFAKLFTYFSLHLADKIIAVSNGVARDFSKRFHISLEKIKVIYNPVILEEIIRKSSEEVDHPWFNSNIPVILGVGRLNKQKDFPTLLKAFARVRKEIDSRLVILGEGEERKKLEKIAKELGIENNVWLPGFVDNPYKFMSRASVLVLSSEYEGFALVLVEALALGCPVVSTNCPSGLSEILENGKYGKLVPIGDAKALALAILDTLKNPLPKEFLQKKAKAFSVENITKEYLNLIMGLKGARNGSKQKSYFSSF